MDSSIRLPNAPPSDITSLQRLSTFDTEAALSSLHRRLHGHDNYDRQRRQRMTTTITTDFALATRLALAPAPIMKGSGPHCWLYTFLFLLL